MHTACSPRHRGGALYDHHCLAPTLAYLMEGEVATEFPYHLQPSLSTSSSPPEVALLPGDMWQRLDTFLIVTIWARKGELCGMGQVSSK